VLWTIETELQGRIAEAPAGEFGFGYDPIFYIPERSKTLAEMPSGEKNQISARGRALRELRSFLLPA
jgi:XTP/dITP diphosphohydrolase